MLESGTELSVSTTVGAYRPLFVSSPATALTVLAADTGTVITFQGGPLPWIHKPASHYARLELDNTDVVHAVLLPGIVGSAGARCAAARLSWLYWYTLYCYHVELVVLVVVLSGRVGSAGNVHSELVDFH